MTRNEWFSAVDKIDDKFINELADYQLRRNQANEKETSGEDITVKPQYVRLESSRFPFKKAAIAVAVVVCVAAAGVFIRMNNKPQTSLPNDSVSGSGAIISDPNISNSGVKLNQEITSAKCYKVDFQTVTEDQVAALFKTAPQKETNEFGTTHFTLDDEKASLGRSPGAGGKGTYYTVMYSTKQGDKYDTAAYRNYSEIAVDKDWSYMSASEAEKKIADILSGFMPTGTSVKAYAISADYYSEYGKKRIEKDWGTSADYYYLTIEQTVNGIPIQSELIGNMDNGTQTWGSEGSAVLSAEGLGYLRVFSPYKIVGEVETTEKFITFPEAEQMFKDKTDSFLTTEKITLEYSRLVYVVLRAENNELILTPAWEFKYNGDKFYRVNAYTGEEVVTV